LPLLDDLTDFARLEVEAGDIEPWAAVLAHLRSVEELDDEQALWAVKLYNATDDIGSTWRILETAPTPGHWGTADRKLVAGLPLSQERRNLRGGRILQHLDSYVGALGGRSQRSWISEAVPPGCVRFGAFALLVRYLRRIWGTGRQSSFEWAEFIAKVAGFPVEPPDGYLWESSGPRQSLEHIYGRVAPNVDWLNTMASVTRDSLASAGVPLSWWDFETVICDFNVMRKGRYYPGKHIAMIREEIESLAEPWRGVLADALRAVVPAPWCDIAPGADKELGRAYRDRGVIVTPVDALREAAL